MFYRYDLYIKSKNINFFINKLRTTILKASYEFLDYNYYFKKGVYLLLERKSERNIRVFAILALSIDCKCYYLAIKYR